MNDRAFSLVSLEAIDFINCQIIIGPIIQYNSTGRIGKHRRRNKKSGKKRALAVEAPRFGKGSGAKEDSSPASRLIIV
jgi:hypothetical protein